MKRNTKRQGGYIYPRAGWWVLRYRDDVLEGGELIRKHLAKQPHSNQARTCPSETGARRCRRHDRSFLATVEQRRNEPAGSKTWDKPLKTRNGLLSFSSSFAGRRP